MRTRYIRMQKNGSEYEQLEALLNTFIWRELRKEFPEIVGFGPTPVAEITQTGCSTGDLAFTFLLSSDLSEERRREILRRITQKFFRFLIVGTPEPARGPRVIKADLPPEEPSCIEHVTIKK